MLGGEKGSVAFHGDHRPAKVATHRRSRNLIGTSGFSPSGTEAQSGVKQTLNEDGSIHIEGTATRNIYPILWGSNSLNWKGIPEWLNIGDTVYMSDCGIKCMNSSRIIDSYNAVLIGAGKLTIPEGTEGVFIYGGFAEKHKYIDADFYPLIAKWEGETVPYEPYGIIEQVIYEPAESTQEGTMLTFDRTYNDRAEVSVFGESVQDGTPTPDSPVPIVSRASVCVETSDADGSKTSTTDLTALLDGRELRSLPDGTRDELQVRDNGDGTGDVVLVERVGNKDMGSAVWLVYTAITTRKIYYTRIDGMVNANSNGMCDGYRWQSWSSLDEIQHGRFQNHPTLTYSYFCNDNAETVDDFKASVAGMRALYQLATPTETVLGTIPMPETFYDTTHVWEANGADISAMVRIMP